MRGRLYLKIVFVIFLSAILFCLIFIIYDKAGTRTHIYDEIVLSDYVIKNENVNCPKGEELIFEDDKYNYYLNCLGSYKIYLIWDDGSKDLVKNALKNKKVTIDSLINHGLEIIKHEK